MSHRFLSVIPVVLVWAFSPCVRAEQASGASRETPVVRVYAKTHKAVVNISGERAVSGGLWPQWDWPGMFDLRGPGFERRVPVLGSGLVVHEDGIIVTNAHVVEGVGRVKAVFDDGREFAARILSADASKDLAVLTIEADEKLPFITLGRSSDLMIGETVVAIGNPYGYSNTVTSGVVSAVGRDLRVSEGYWLRGLIQTDASINPGNSGGPLLNIEGELIGVNTAIRAEAQNIGFAIPVDTLVENLSQMLMPEKLRRVRLGLTMGRIRTAGPYKGLAVDAVTRDTPAEQNGLIAGDLILAVDGQPLQSVIDFYVKVMHKEVGEPIRLTYARPRQGALQTHQTELTLLPRPLPDGRALAQHYFQMEVSPLTAAVAQRFNFDGAYPILIVVALEPRGAAAEAGIREGDLIVQVNDATVRDLTELARELEQVDAGDTAVLTIIRISLGVFGQIERRLSVRVEARPREASPSRR
ncbi:MAG: trypsin-like peptidase domain-containing protein [Sedimentisphaerales bacterium]|nr:trypsin-like peptidase domain-containing protein [Sedimentisphaerales bacterium]